MGQKRHFLELQAQTGDKDAEDTKVRLNLFSSETGGFLYNSKRANRVVRSQYAIEATLDTKNDGRLWQGTAWLELDDGIPDRLVDSLIPILLLNLGVTVTVKRYPQR